MILIDALQIKSGGGYGLLVSLVNGLIKQQKEYVVLLNDSTRKANIEGVIIEENSSASKRGSILKKYVKKYNPTSLITFNFPPPFRPDCKVITDFQNLHLAKSSDTEKFTLKERFKVFLKRKYLRLNLSNTDYYVFPSDFVMKSFKGTFNVSDDICFVLPHFDEKTLSDIKEEAKRLFTKEKNSFIYVSSPSEHKNHINLLKAWEILLQKEYKPALALSLPTDDVRSTSLLEYAEMLNSKGANITNINDDKGVLPYKEVLFNTYKREYTIFPSLNETFGFGLVEGAFFDNKILASQKPFVNFVAKPSLFFDPYNPEDIANAVIMALNGNLKDTELVFRNRIDDIIALA